jgi:hypothetical protein
MSAGLWSETLKERAYFGDVVVDVETELRGVFNTSKCGLRQESVRGSSEHGTEPPGNG